MEFSITKMAELHGITRQTLIYYDKIGLFHPARVDQNGRRFYNSDQMPFLREICFLKNMNVPLKIIEESIHGRSTNSIISLLENQIEQIERKQQKLEQMKASLKDRLSLYHEANNINCAFEQLTIEYFPVRRALFVAWPQEKMNRELLHLCYAEAEKQFSFVDGCNIYGFGALMQREKIMCGKPVDGAGSIFFIPSDAPQFKNEMIIPAGNYVCTFSLCMPYRPAPVWLFWETCMQRGICTKGDMINVCLLDSTFHDEQRKEDFCQLQMRISEPES